MLCIQKHNLMLVTIGKESERERECICVCMVRVEALTIKLHPFHHHFVRSYLGGGNLRIKEVIANSFI